jgi:hypothetical protein
MSSAKTATANYTVQYKVTFDQTGLDNTATGTVENLNGLLLTRENLPYSIWVDNLTVENFTYSSIVSSTTSGKRFRLDNVKRDNLTGTFFIPTTGQITVIGPENVTGNYVTQFDNIPPTLVKELSGTGTSLCELAIAPIADSWVELKNPTTNKGSDQTLHVRVEVDSKGNATNLRRSYLKFDLSGLPPLARIDNAILHLFRSGDEGVPSIYSTENDNWTENKITWNNQPKDPQNLENDSGTLLLTDWIEWGITNYIASEFDGDKVLSVVVKFEQENGVYQHADFTSREGTLNPRPWLEIYYSINTYSPDNGVTVTLTVTDPAARLENEYSSGVENIEYSFDGSTWIFYTGPFTIKNEGVTTLYHRTWDKAGNMYELPHQTIEIYHYNSELAIAPTADSWVELKNPTTNKGSDQTLHVRVEVDSKGNATNLRRSYLKFDLLGLPPCAIIDGAILHLYRTTSEDSIPSVYSTADNWIENGIKWNNQSGPGALENDSGTASGNWVEWDITSYAASEFNGDNVLSVVLKFDPENGSYQHSDFTSREGALGQRPWLEISYSINMWSKH